MNKSFTIIHKYLLLAIELFKKIDLYISPSIPLYPIPPYPMLFTYQVAYTNMY